MSLEILDPCIVPLSSKGKIQGSSDNDQWEKKN